MFGRCQEVMENGQVHLWQCEDIPSHTFYIIGFLSPLPKPALLSLSKPALPSLPKPTLHPSRSPPSCPYRSPSSCPYRSPSSFRTAMQPGTNYIRDTVRRVPSAVTRQARSPVGCRRSLAGPKHYYYRHPTEPIICFVKENGAAC